MGSFSNYLEGKVLDHVVGKTSFTMPTAYVGLSTADPTEDGSGNAEQAAGVNGYQRVQTAGTDWAAAGTSGATSNATKLTFPQASGSWGTIAYFTVWDANKTTGGNLLFYGTVSPSKAVGAGDTPEFAIGDLDVTLD